MKKRGRLMPLVLALLLLAACGPKYEGEAKNDFRAADWGASMAKVAKTEEVEYTYGSDELLLYQVVENGDEMQVFYYFEDDKLVSGEIRVMMEDQLTDALMKDMIESYLRFRERVTELYGAPVNDDYRVWLDDEGDRADRDSFNIYFRHLMYETEWDTETTYMKLTFDYHNDLINYIFTAEPKAE